MGLFSKLKEAQEKNKANGVVAKMLFNSLKKDMIADGKEHIAIKRIALIGNQKAINALPTYAATQGFEILDIDLSPIVAPGAVDLHNLKVKYRSTN